MRPLGDFYINKNKLFDYLKRQKISELIELLDNCYDCMKASQIRQVFGHIENAFLKESLGDGEDVLKAVNKFMDDSLKGIYYSPFNINSKNFMDVPEETDLWFEKLAELLTESKRLSTQGDHVNAVKCFGVLFKLINKMESEDEIVFADELGRWMLPIEEEPCINEYFKSAAAILEPEEYVNAVLLVIRYNRHSSLTNKVYEKAKRAANKKQKLLLEDKMIQQQIRTGKNRKIRV